jgi:hypothetical protein
MKKLAISMAIAALAACGGEDDKKDQPAGKAPPPAPVVPKAPKDDTPPPPPPSDAPVSTPLSELGLQIDVPGTWGVKWVKDHYTIKIPFLTGTRIPPVMNVVRLEAPAKGKPPLPKNVDVASKDCPAKVIEKQTLDDGRFYYVCEQTAAGRTLRNFRVLIPEPAGSMIQCSGNAGEVSAMIAACQTLRTP